MSAIALRVAVAASLVFGLAGVCAAQSRAEVLIGARACVSESGWHDHATCAAQIHLLQRRAKRLGLSFVRMVRAYCTEWATRRRPWVFELRDSPRAPAHWPSSASWTVHRPLFAALLLVVRRALTGGPDPCHGEADHFAACWVDRTDLGWRRVECPGTSDQCFWRLP